MVPQESEDRVVPQGRRKPFPTREVEPRGGGKAIPVEEADRQQLLLFATADNPPRGRGADLTKTGDRSPIKARSAPKAKSKQRQAGSPRVSSR